MITRLELVSNRENETQFNLFINASTRDEDQHLAEMESEAMTRRQVVQAWLKPTDMGAEQDYLMRIRADYPTTCRWLWEDETFLEWFNPHHSTSASANLLWLNGKPGAGKTILASKIVEEAKSVEPTPTVLFFYFKQDDLDRNNFISMARTMLMQIIEQNPHCLDFFYTKCCNSGGSLLTTRTVIEELLSQALRNCDSAYIVLDGLDECCSRKERGEIVHWLRNLIEKLPPDDREQLRCLFVSQHDSARKDYRHLETITVDEGKNEEDIEIFGKIQSAMLVERFSITEQRAKDIAASVTASAEGMSSS